jgi:hypothetical protein
MKKIIPLFWALTMGLAGCSSADNPQPTPTPTASLQAKWQGVTTQQVDTTPSGAVVYDNTTTYPAGSYYIEFTANEVLLYSNTTVSKRFAYTRTGNTITPTQAVAGDSPQQIKELTDSRLVLTSATPKGANTMTLTTTYSR